VFRVFGADISVSRFVVSLETAFLAAAILWPVNRLTGRVFFSCVLASPFALFVLLTPARAVANHRWDSNTFAVGAVVLAAAAAGKSERRLTVLAGICAAAAAWVTPPFLIVVAALGARQPGHQQRPRLRRLLPARAPGRDHPPVQRKHLRQPARRRRSDPHTLRLEWQSHRPLRPRRSAIGPPPDSLRSRP